MTVQPLPSALVPVRSGDTLSMKLVLKTLVNDVETPVDLTGSVIAFSFQTTNGTIHKKSNVNGSGVVVTSPATGVVEIELTPAETRRLKIGRKSVWQATRMFGGKEENAGSGIFDVTEGIALDG